MSQRIEDYALIGDTFTAALVGKDGSVDWLCLPRFDAPACFAALLGTPDNGRWQIAPIGRIHGVSRRYRPGTLVLDTRFETEDGVAVVTDFMPISVADERVDLVRIVSAVEGTTRFKSELAIRFDYGRVVPWVRRHDGAMVAVAGPDAVHFDAPVPIDADSRRAITEFSVAAGQQLAFSVEWHPSHRVRPRTLDPIRALDETENWWRRWSSRCHAPGEWHDAVERSLITLKALTYSPTGGIVAAATTSLPEQPGGIRNWDYRYCWLRDATFTLYALMNSGYRDEAVAWREWLLRATASHPEQVQSVYGLAGEPRLPEWDVPWLPGYEGSHPVRVGNLARSQLQIDVFGEIMDVLHAARAHGIEPLEEVWSLHQAFLDCIESVWCQPDEGLWEVRGPRRHFTHSKVMAWLAIDRMVKDAERYRLPLDFDRWRDLRAHIHADVCRHGYDHGQDTFVQYYGAKDPDASLLMIPLVGFLPCQDPRVQGTVRAIERRLMEDGLVRRYRNSPDVDGLPPGEGAFLACSFWYADVLVMSGRRDEALALFERLLALRNDVGLLAEEYDTVTGRQLGNFPQAFSHVALINTAHNLATWRGPAHERSQGQPAV